MSNIATALAIQEACSNAMYADEPISIAAEIAHEAAFNPNVLRLLLKYTATLTAGVATNLTSVLMSESDFNHMMNELQEMGEFDV